MNIQMEAKTTYIYTLEAHEIPRKTIPSRNTSFSFGFSGSLIFYLLCCPSAIAAKLKKKKNKKIYMYIFIVVAVLEIKHNQFPLQKLKS